MPEESVTDGSEGDVTLNEEWLEENKDRLVSWDWMRQFVFGGMRPLQPKEIADRIGEDKGFIYWILRRIRKPTREKLNQIERDAD